MSKRILVTLTGYSCSGKTSMVRELVEMGIPEVISFTTRPKRAGEVDGLDYHFINHTDALILEEKGGIIERNTYNDHWYGITKNSLEQAFAKSKVAVVIVDPNGLAQLAAQAGQHGYTVYSVFVTAPFGDCLTRMLVRLLEAVKDENTSSVLASYARRIQLLLQHEAYWYDKWPKWDLIIDNPTTGSFESALGRLWDNAIAPHLEKELINE